MPNHENPFAFNAEADKTVTVSGRGPTNLNAFVSPVNLQKTVSVLLGLFGLLCILTLISSGMQLSLLDEALQGVGPNFDQRAEENDNRELAVNMLVLVSMLVVGIVSLKLLHRLRSNVDHLGAIGLTNTPGWSVGWFFVPLANLIKPLGATRETWQASIAPDAWQTEAAPPVLGTWWFFWITASIVGRVASRLPSIAGNSIESLITATWVDMGHTTLTMMAAFMYWKVLSGITTAQTETYQSMAAESPPDQWKY